MTADLTPAQAARLEDVERVARAIYEADPDETEGGEPIPWEAWFKHIHDHYRRLAVAAIDVMRGATDDGAVGRVLALADEFDAATLPPLLSDFDRGLVAGYARAAARIRAAVGAPATAEPDITREPHYPEYVEWLRAGRPAPATAEGDQS